MNSLLKEFIEIYISISAKNFLNILFEKIKIVKPIKFLITIGLENIIPKEINNIEKINNINSIILNLNLNNKDIENKKIIRNDIGNVPI